MQVISHYDDLLLNIPEVDYILTGEADYTFTNFLEALSLNKSLKVPGLAQRMNGKISYEPLNEIVDLDSLPFIKYDLWPIKEAIEKDELEKVLG